MTENFAQQGKFKSMVPEDFLFCPYSTVCVLYSVQYVPDNLVYAGGVSDVTYCVQYVPDNLVYAGGGGFP